MSEELKSCPFCGGNSIDHFMNWSVPSIGCDTCGAAIGGKDEEMVIKKWNTRAASQNIIVEEKPIPMGGCIIK